MRIHIKHNFKKIPKELGNLVRRDLKKAIQRAANEAATKLRKEMSIEARKVYRLPAGEQSSKGGRGTRPPGVKGMLFIDKARSPNRGTPINQIGAAIRTSNKPISLIHFVRGAKTPPKQSGVPVERRKRVRVSISKGSTKVLPKAFIQEARGAVQLFKSHKRGKKWPMKKQSAPSLFEVFKKPRQSAPLRSKAGEYYQERLLHHLRFYAGKVERK